MYVRMKKYIPWSNVVVDEKTALQEWQQKSKSEDENRLQLALHSALRSG